MITQGQTTSFKEELYEGVHDLLTDTLKIALYTAFADIGSSTTVYTTTNEVSGGGYTAGGETLTGVTINASGNTAYVSFNNVSWAGATFTARGALIYNSSKANRSIAVLNFGADRTGAGVFTITFPPNNATNAVIRST